MEVGGTVAFYDRYVLAVKRLCERCTDFSLAVVKAVALADTH
jgi:hypothetical protein